MKKDIKKRFYLVAMIASLALLWGGTSCSNGSDDNDDVNTEDTSTTGVTTTFDENEKEVKKASEIPEKATSIKITVTGITGTTTDESWWFWAKTNAGDGDKIEWKSGEAENAIYELTVSDETKIAYIKENGLYIKGAPGLSAKVSVSITESTDNSATPGGGNENGDAGNNGDNDTEAPPETDKTLLKDFAYTADGNLIEVCPAEKLTSISPKSITIYVANVSGTGDWWCSYDANGGDWTSIKENWDESIKGYKKTITDSAEISYFKENGIKIGMLAGLTATVTVTWE